MSPQGFTTSADLTGRRFLLESLPLVASYLFQEAVNLEPVAVGHRAAEAFDDETTDFLLELEVRHALACAMNLRGLITDIERKSSTSSSLYRAESKAVIRGRLDVPRYIARRSTQRSLPKTYCQ